MWFAAALAALLTSMGCTRTWCEHHGYYPAVPATAGCQPCCVPCCPAPAPATTYAPPPAQSYWNTPPACTCPPPHQ